MQGVPQIDEVVIDFPEIETISAEAQDIPINIIYQDKDLLVINKQAGLVVHPCSTTKRGTLVNALAYHFKDDPNYVGKSITISTTHAYIKGNSTYGDATYCLFLSAAPNGKTPEVLPNVTKLSDLGSTSGSQNMDVLLDKSIIVERFDVVTEATKDTYVTKSVTVPAGAKYVYFTHTRKGGSDKEANIIFN